MFFHSKWEACSLHVYGEELGFEQLLELREEDARCVQMAAYRTAKDAITIRPGRIGLELLFQLAQTVLLELLKSKRGERNAVAALLRFRLRLNIAPFANQLLWHVGQDALQGTTESLSWLHYL